MFLVHFYNFNLLIQNQQFELDNLLERGSEISSQADERNRNIIEKQTSEVSENWNVLVSDLSRRKETLSKLADIWDLFEGRWQNFENLLTGLEEKSKHIDYIVRSKQHVITNIQTIEVRK